MLLRTYCRRHIVVFKLIPSNWDESVTEGGGSPSTTITPFVLHYLHFFLGQVVRSLRTIIGEWTVLRRWTDHELWTWEKGKERIQPPSTQTTNEDAARVRHEGVSQWDGCIYPHGHPWKGQIRSISLSVRRWLLIFIIK